MEKCSTFPKVAAFTLTTRVFAYEAKVGGWENRASYVPSPTSE